jgi:hypothetical protein
MRWGRNGFRIVWRREIGSVLSDRVVISIVLVYCRAVAVIVVFMSLEINLWVWVISRKKVVFVQIPAVYCARFSMGK